MNSFIEAHGVTFRVGARALVADVNLSLRSGEVACIVGPNGAGKSTLLKLLAGELAPTSGTVICGGQTMARHAAWRLACLRAVLPQASQLFLPLSVTEVATLGLEGVGRYASRAARLAWLEDAMGGVDIAHLARRNYQTLSGGEQQRVHFARVMCQLAAGRTVEPQQALFLDEPTANLDLSHQMILLETARRLAKTGTALLVVLHDLNLAAAFADRLIAMKDGCIAADGPPRRVFTDTLVRDVFSLDLKVGETPATPFVLPRPRS